MLGEYKTVQKSCRFTEEEMRFILDNFSKYGDCSFNFCLSNLIDYCYQHKEQMDEEIKQAVQRLKTIKQTTAEYERVLQSLKSIENSVQYALQYAKDIDKELQE